MKKLYSYIILGLLALYVCPCSAQLLATSNYDQDAGTLVVTLRNVSDSLSCAFIGAWCGPATALTFGVIGAFAGAVTGPAAVDYLIIKIAN